MLRTFEAGQQPRFKFLTNCAVVLLFFGLILDVSLLSSDAIFYFSVPGTVEPVAVRNERFESAFLWASDVQGDPVNISEFKELGHRLNTVKQWVSYVDNARLPDVEREDWTRLINTVVSDLVPFIQHGETEEGAHLDRLRGTFVPGSRGLVIATGKDRFRYACHLVGNIRHVLKSELPIQIAYAGEDDLPRVYRDFIVGLAANVSVFDVTAIFDEDIAGLRDSGWGIKPFAVLGSTFEQAILLDADAIFLQPPEVIFDEHPGYLERGNVLFHDRLLSKGGYKARHDWWEHELSGHNLSDTIKLSKAYNDGYGEEGDSGVVAIDKSRTDVLFGLLHIAWQNTKDVRQKYTYVQGHGDKESWWFGFELTSTAYSMEEHYGSIVGHEVDEEAVCGFTIAHVDHKRKLLWYNGSLLKNKREDLSEFDVPFEWMIDGEWEKGTNKEDLSCMFDAPVHAIDNVSVIVITQSVERAMRIDRSLNQTIPGLITW